MTPETKVIDPSEIAALDAQASALMKQGMGLLYDGSGDAHGALRCFDLARELRGRLPVEVPIHGYGLAACWLNRAEALTRLGGPEDRARAVHAYDEAIVLLHALPLAEDGRFVRRLAIAYQNHALVLRMQEPPATADAIRSLSAAATVLERDDVAPFSDRAQLLAVVWVNLANARASELSADADVLARAAATRALMLVATIEGHAPDAAEVGIKARHVLCQTIARQLSSRSASTQADPMPEAVHDATDMAEEGLALIRQWERSGVSRFRDLASDLFRFGAHVYARYQPHFLAEFVLEHRDAQQSSREYVDSAEMRAAFQDADRLLLALSR